MVGLSQRTMGKACSILRDTELTVLFKQFHNKSFHILWLWWGTQCWEECWTSSQPWRTALPSDLGKYGPLGQWLVLLNAFLEISKSLSSIWDQLNHRGYSPAKKHRHLCCRSTRLPAMDQRRNMRRVTRRKLCFSYMLLIAIWWDRYYKWININWNDKWGAQSHIVCVRAACNNVSASSLYHNHGFQSRNPIFRYWGKAETTPLLGEYSWHIPHSEHHVYFTEGFLFLLPRFIQL